MEARRNLALSENMTVDGVIDFDEGWFSPPGADSGLDTSDLEEVLREHMARQDALLLGRRTFEAFRDYWPKQANDRTGIDWSTSSTGISTRSARRLWAASVP